jgi:uncharacterized membrane protein YgdD (TMEM256/DUF423 family)
MKNWVFRGIMLPLNCGLGALVVALVLRDQLPALGRWVEQWQDLLLLAPLMLLVLSAAARSQPRWLRWPLFLLSAWALFVGFGLLVAREVLATERAPVVGGLAILAVGMVVCLPLYQRWVINGDDVPAQATNEGGAPWA